MVPEKFDFPTQSRHLFVLAIFLRHPPESLPHLDALCYIEPRVYSSFLIILLLGIAFLWLGVLSFFYFYAVRHYKKLVGQNTELDLEAVLEKIAERVEADSQSLQGLEKFTNQLREDSSFHLQKIGLVRYNPFEETGGNQSFAVALLNESGDGVVISSLHARDLTRVYGKPVKAGKMGGYEFSKEEKQAVEKALGE